MSDEIRCGINCSEGCLVLPEWDIRTICAGSLVFGWSQPFKVSSSPRTLHWFIRCWRFWGILLRAYVKFVLLLSAIFLSGHGALKQFGYFNLLNTIPFLLNSSWMLRRLLVLGFCFPDSRRQYLASIVGKRDLSTLIRFDQHVFEWFEWLSGSSTYFYVDLYAFKLRRNLPICRKHRPQG